MWVASGLGAFAIAVISVAITVRISRLTRPVPVFALIGGIIGFLFAGYGLWRHGFDPSVIGGVTVYAFACELYIFLFTLAGNSVSLRLLAELSKGPLRRRDIAAHYQTDAMVERRFVQLKKAGLVSGGPAALSLTAEGKLFVWAFKTLRTTFGMSAEIRE